MNQKIVERAGWKGECPSCHSPFLWTKFNLMNGVQPYLYCERSGNILLRQTDLDQVHAVARSNGQREPSLEQLRVIWVEMESKAPLCHCGARFSFLARPKCLTCGHNLLAGGRDELIQSNWIIILDGAIVVKDTIESSYQVRVTSISPTT